MGSDKKKKENKLLRFFGFGVHDDGEEGSSSTEAESVNSYSVQDPEDSRFDSDWKPFVDFSDEEVVFDDNDETEFFEEEGPLLSVPEDKEADNKIDEEKDPPEQHAEHGEDADSLGESQALDDGGGEQAEEGPEETQGDGLLEYSGDSGDGGTEESPGRGGSGGAEEERGSDGDGNSEEESGNGEAGERPETEEAETVAFERGEDEVGERISDLEKLFGELEIDDGAADEAAEAEKAAPEDEDDDGEDSADFGGEEIDVSGGESLSWNRKSLRIAAEKTGARIVVDDDVMTAVTAGYIDRNKFNEEKQKIAAANEAGEDISLLIKEAEKKAVPAAVPDESAVRISDNAFRKILDTLGDEDADVNALTSDDTGEVNGQAERGAETPEGEASADGSGLTNGDNSEEPERDEELLDYDDVFQDDPGVTRKKTRKKKILAVVKEIVKSVLLFLGVFIVFIFCYLTFTVYCVRNNHVIGSSMEPTLHNGDEVRSSLLPYVFGKPKVGDIVIVDTDRIGKGFSFFERVGDVLRTNEGISKMFFKGQEEDVLWIKRVVAVGGDVVEFRDGQFYRNGELVIEDYIYDQTVVTYPSGEKIEVPEGYVFVMGDNRNVSQDSREIGVVPIYALTGKKM